MRRKVCLAIVGTLLAVLILLPSTLCAQSTAASAKLDLGYITPGTVAAIVLHPQRVLKSPEMELLPTEVISAAGKKELGIDPLEIEQIVVIAEAGQAGPEMAIVLRMASPLAEGKILAPLWGRTTEAQLNGKTYQQGNRKGMDLSIFRADDRTLLAAHDDLLRKVLSNHASPQPGKMTQILGHIAEPPDVLAILLVEPLRPIIANSPLQMLPLPSDVMKIPDLVSSIGVKMNLIGDTAMSLTLRATDEAAALKLERIIEYLLVKGKKAVVEKTARQADSNDPVEQAAAKYAQRMTERVVKAIRPVRKGQNLTLAHV